MELLKNGLEVEKEGSKTALPSATKVSLLKHSFTLDDVSMLENMNNTCDSSLQKLLALITKSLKGAEESLCAMKPVNMATNKGDQEWEKATTETDPSCLKAVALEVDDEDLNRTLTGEEEVCQVAAISSLQGLDWRQWSPMEGSVL